MKFVQLESKNFGIYFFQVWLHKTLLGYTYWTKIENEGVWKIIFGRNHVVDSFGEPLVFPTRKEAGEALLEEYKKENL